ncbi:tyrosine recombinase XerC [Deinococcus xinjiangensis]|uniref:Tyrosine recombinase XerC n=1 Tax=Deinococcus xinjiangensis TaxID=457454 RepID=A0ABP9VDJ8_9DEIO
MNARRLELAGGAPVKEQALTVSALLDRWLKVKAAQVESKRTAQINADLVRLHIKPRIGGLKVKALDSARVLDFYTELATETDLQRTRQQIHNALCQALDYAQLIGVVQFNAAKAVKVPRVARPKRELLEEDGEVMAWSLDQTRALYAACLKDGTPHALAIAFALYTGARRGEVFGLRWKDIDLTPSADAPYGTAAIRQAVTCTPDGPEAGRLKTSSSRRTLRLNRRARAALDAVKAWREEKAQKGGWTDSGLVFTTRTGTVQHPSNVKRKLAELTTALGIPQNNFHCCRHTFCSLALAAGQPVAAVSAALGHKSVQVTLTVYAHYLDTAAPLLDLSSDSRGYTKKQRGTLKEADQFALSTAPAGEVASQRAKWAN